MIILFCLISLLGIGVYIEKKSYNYDLLGIALYVISIIYIIIHLLLWSISGYEFNKFVAKRAAFIQTLKISRELNNPIESAAILKDISKWNQDLASAKYDNTVFLLSDYVDDRVDTLQFIK